MHCCKISSLIPALLCGVLILHSAFGQNNEEVDKCLEDTLRIRPELKDRFDVGMLKVACKKRIQWDKSALNGVGKSASNPLLTPSQTAWADKLYQCFDQQCMCQMFDRCSNELKRVANDPFADWRNTSTFQFRRIDRRSIDAYLMKLPGFEHVVKSGTLRQKRAVISQVESLLAQRIGKGTRKELRRLSDDERRRFFAALQSLKTDKIDTMSKYDIMIVQHTAEYSPGAHFSASFLPFHREFAKVLEMAIRTIDPGIALPYWDPTLDQGLPDPRDSILWTEDFLGNGFGDVVNGPFANWTTVTDPQVKDLSPNRRIVRNIGVSQYGSLYRDSDIDAIIGRRKFRDLVYCVDPFFELVHGANHLWMGGHMNELRISPNDPVFFLFHSFVDYIWEEWRQKNQDYNTRSQEFVDGGDSCNQFSQSQAKMRPYSISNIEGMSNQYTDVLYDFEPRPTCSSSQPNCGSPYLFCHTGKSKCMSKIKSGGNCLGLENFDPCWNGNCVNSRCVLTGGRDSVDTTVAPAPTPPTRAPARAAVENQNSVWVPITVLSLNGRTGGAIPTARIVTTEESTNQQMTGSVADPSEKPYYAGQAFAQVKSPFSQSAPVKVQVEVFDDTGRKCASMCQEQGTIYNPCEVTFTLTATSQQADGVAFAQSVTLAKQLNWQGGKHLPDRYLFMCPTGKSRSPPGPAPATNEPTTTTRTTTPLPKMTNPPLTTPGIGIAVNQRGSGPSTDDIVIKVVHSDDGATTARPSTIGAPPAGQPPASASQTVDSCGNDHRCCPIWAAVGECSRNQWMKSACRRVCGACKPRQIVNGGCSDLHPKCAQWADAGQCDTNDLWMEENCKRSCDVCDRSINELKSLCGAAPKTGGCTDRDTNCITWAKEWECVNNPWWMKENCPESCNYCNARFVQ